jgi:hypothetical protein
MTKTTKAVETPVEEKPEGNDQQPAAASTTSENTTSNESSGGAQDDTASNEQQHAESMGVQASTFGADAAGLMPGAPANTDEMLQDALDEVKPVDIPEQNFSHVADRVEEETAGLHRGPDQTLRTDDDKVAWAPPGSYDAAVNGVQQDASGSFESANKTRSHQSGTRI